MTSNRTLHAFRLHAIAFLALLLLNCNSISAQGDIFEIVRNGSAEDLSNLLKSKPEAANALDDNGYTPLLLAAYHGHKEMVEMLAPLVEDIDYNSSYGTALMGTSVKGHTEIAEILLNHGANPNALDADGTTPLIFAAMFQNEELALALLEAGADPNIKNQKGFSALDYAEMHKNTTLIIKFENHKN